MYSLNILHDFNIEDNYPLSFGDSNASDFVKKSNMKGKRQKLKEFNNELSRL